MRHYSLIIPVVFMIAGCSSATTPPIHEYTIYTPSQLSQKVQKTSPKILRLSATRSIPSLESKQLSYLRSSGESGTYLYTRWSDTPSLLIERSLYRSLTEKGLFSTILSPTSSSTADFVLESDLHAFYHHFEDAQPSKGVIDITYRLIDTKSKLPFASKHFLITKDAPSEDAIGGVKALSEATNELTQLCTQWIEERTKE